MQQGEGSNPDSDSEGEAPEPPQAPCGRPRRARHVNPTKKRDAPSIPRLPSPEPGDGDSSEDEECVTLSTPVVTPASIQEEVVQSTIVELTLTLQIYQVMFKPCLIMHLVNMNQNQTMVQKLTLTVLHP